ncbi:MAG: polysaccharide deacetylase family protein [Prevotellaceae bacterium]|jgi:polysaccharide deacetylase family protein (PEP-CTERM system associated)|nr:polysaccharide deacetylase family protein [Prevotellaceae bacterium]
MNILTFDVEEWFHLLENASTRTEKEWNTYPVRIHENMDRIFDILERHGQKATFFVLGWIARRYPEVIRKICDKGYDIGFHTTYHELVHQLTPEAFRRGLAEGLDYFQQATGKKVLFFRAPGFSLTERCSWAFDVLAEMGIAYDSSVFPTGHAHGGYPSFPSHKPTLVKTNHGEIMEFPISSAQVAGKSFVFSGGGYFRLFPYPIIKYYTNKADYVTSYLHPRDLDARQPMIKGLPLKRRFKSYVGLKTAARKVEKWLRDFEFTDIRTAASLIDWSQTPVLDLRN